MSSVVRRLVVDGAVVYAKTSVLGVPLVAVMRGDHGSWAQVRDAQQGYVGERGGLLERQAAQLSVLHRGRRPQVPPLLGYRDGVLFTGAVPGMALSDIVLASPELTAPALRGVMQHLDGLHRSATARLVIGAPIVGRSISDVHEAAFHGPAAEERVARLRADRPAETAVLCAVVDRIRHLPDVNGLGRPGSSLVYGALDPGHIVFPEGLSAEPVFLSPGLARDRAAVDPATLLSRLVLAVLAAGCGRSAAEQVAQGLAHFAYDQATTHLPGFRDQALRTVLTLWAMDTVNTMATCLGVPDHLSLPAEGAVLVDRAGAVLEMVHTLVVALSAGYAAEKVLVEALAAVVEAAA